jgi:uncharacterized membrane protein
LASFSFALIFPNQTERNIVEKQTMAKKYDTNPLDPDFPQRAKEMQTETLLNSGAKTQPFPYAAPTEEQTRRFGDANFSAYTSSFDASDVPANFKTAQFKTDEENASKRPVSKVGLPEHILTALPYIPFYVGMIAGILLLLFVPKSETKVRFHAAQGLAVHIGILIINSVLKGAGHITDLADLGNMIFSVVTLVMLIIWTVKAWTGKPVHVESADDLTNWLEEKIKPRS